uniref:Olfactory receptor n=1 Tax=Pelusios castaneus TaxID=367368 RepID=A0A8C8VK64_9SAUR
MPDPDWGNQTAITEFILLGFGDLPDVHIFLFMLFLVIYFTTVAGNSLVMALIVADHQLHTPMYFFLGNLSCLEICYSTTILPKILVSLLTGDRTISVSGCITQLYFFGSLIGTECCLLAVMSYDRYLAICKPLHYSATMNTRLCFQLLASGSWTGGFLASSITTVLISQFTFCGSNVMDHFFCDFIPLVKLSCNDPQQMEMLAFTLCLIFSLVPFLLTMISYICIITTILRIPSTTGKQKAFSTCFSHLTVVSIFYGTVMLVYMFPTTSLLRDVKKVFSVFYTILTPLVNPLVYSLRNKEVKEALRKAYRKCRF